MTTDHIEVKGRGMYCTRCEACRTVKMPSTIDDIIKQMDAFRDQHVDCPPHTIEAEMSEYIKGFDAGCEHLMREIELHNRKWPHFRIEQLVEDLRKGLK